MKYLDVCSGISAPTMAWKPLGWEALCFAEIEAAPRAVLAHHYPDIPLRGDFTEIQGDEYGPVDLLVGGTPCQDFSVAGLRAGLDGDRGNLSLEYLRLADRARPRWLVWENVPGVLSIDGGRAFGAILGGMAELGYGFAYRVLDAQHFGVPQRRRRVFVVGYLGDWRRAAAVLFERHSLQGHPAPRREAGEGVAISSSGGASSREWPADVAPALDTTMKKYMGYDNQHINGGAGWFVPATAHSLRVEPFTAKDHGADASDIAPTLRAGGHGGSHANAGVMPAVAFMENQRAELRLSEQVNLTVGGGKPGQGYPAALYGSAVRRLTPRECERLQGFPDDFTLVPYRKGLMKDGPRYKMLGNSMAVPVVRWIGERIAAVEALGSVEQAEAA